MIDIVDKMRDATERERKSVKLHINKISKHVSDFSDLWEEDKDDELYRSEIKNDADILRTDNEVLTLRTTNEVCKSFNERYERWEREQNESKAESEDEE